MSEIQWNSEQKQAIQQILDWVNNKNGERNMSLSGFAGCGKSTLMKEVSKHIRKDTISWTAMTGKAALRLSQASNVPASTLHSQLYGRPKFGKRGSLLFEHVNMEKRPDILVIDESSMTNAKIYEDLQIWVENGTKILFVGDPFQLPPVQTPEEEAKYGEDFSIFHIVKGPVLTKVMRSSDDVVKVATVLREEGKLQQRSEGKYEFRRAHLPEKIAIDDYFSNREDHALITWRNAMRMSSNKEIRKRLGYPDIIPMEGEPVLICKNSKEYLNGEVVTVRDFKPGPRLGEMNTYWLTDNKGIKNLVSVDGRNTKLDGMMPIKNDWKAYVADKKKIGVEDPVPVTYGYSFSCHKYQGNEAKRVTVFLAADDTRNPHFIKKTKLPDGRHIPFATRWTYTAITRAKEQVTVILGEFHNES